MEIKVAKYAGFCCGVKRAVDAVFEMIRKPDHAPIFTIGSLIHNPDINRRLRENGVTIVEESLVDEMLHAAPENAVFVIRTHGVTKEIREKLAAFEAKNPNSQVLDMTCPFVAKIYRIMQENTGDGTYTVLMGNKDHPEVIGITSYIKGDFCVFSSADAVENSFLTNTCQKMFRIASFLHHKQHIVWKIRKKAKNFLKNYIQTAYFLIQYVMLRKLDRKKSNRSLANAMRCSSWAALKAQIRASYMSSPSAIAPKHT